MFYLSNTNNPVNFNFTLLNHTTIGSYDCYYDYLYESHIESNILFLYSGECYDSNGEKINLERIKTEGVDLLKNSDGYFTFIIIDKGSVKVFKSLYRRGDIFWKKNGTNLFISDDLSILFNNLSDIKINDKFCRGFIESETKTFGDTPFKEINKAPGGCELIFDLESGVSVNNFQDLEKNESDFFSSLENVIKSFSNNRNVYLHYSGGLDSTIVFLTLKMLGIPFQVIHHVAFDFEQDSEKKLVIDMCNKYCIKYHLIKPKFEECDTEDAVQHPNDLALCGVSYHSETFDYNSLNFDSDIIFDGQGGDALFVQYPSWNIGYQLICANKTKLALKKINELSKLKNIPPLKIFKHTFKLFLNKKNTYNTHPLILKRDAFSADFEHQCNVLNMIESREHSSTLTYQTYSPLLSLNPVKSWLTHDYDCNFNSNLDRSLIRDIALLKFEEKLVLNIRKRSSVNVGRELLNFNEELIDRMLNQTTFLTSIGLDNEEFREEYYLNSNIRYTEKCSSIQNAAILFKYFSQFNLV
ncbi:hypothetical protein [Pantoea vagans]|uniref:hypothetical protein n=1 Tax=Pantoea vagans TaxID=470934 RepID=UPI003209D192